MPTDRLMRLFWGSFTSLICNLFNICNLFPFWALINRFQLKFGLQKKEGYSKITTSLTNVLFELTSSLDCLFMVSFLQVGDINASLVIRLGLSKHLNRYFSFLFVFFCGLSSQCCD